MGAPIRLLSQDILEIIFLDPEIHGVVSISGSPSRVVEGNPHLLASVSYYWRCVALGIPRLWSSFQVKGCAGQYSLRRLQLCLERSKDATLSGMQRRLRSACRFWMQSWHTRSGGSTYPSSHHPPNIFTCSPQCVVASACSSKLRSSCTAPSPKSSIERTRMRSTKLPSCRQSDWARSAVWDNFLSFPSTKFGHSELCCDTLSMLFPTADNIIIDSSSTYPSHAVPKLHRGTKIIIILGGEAKETNMMDIFRRLTTPNLEQLHIIACGLWDAPSVLAFIPRSACPLHSLVLHNTRVRAGPLLELLRVTPSLQALTLTELLPNSITDLIMTALTPGSEVALPALTHIVLAGVYLFTTGALLRMLEARTTSLVVVDLTLPGREVGPADRARFAALQPSVEYQSAVPRRGQATRLD
ncbi:hypothetical protein FB451DRAFT_680384 [Mycena latifolia]|nr:hypothetical protein FB451DRAFT_680384 [Mycena latifolia]